ncbi:PepSY domain-containing protein [Planococcus sp. MERTA32b]|nr:PepSY domain-containing protein [Planococcus sp. MER TA 32b]
MKKWIAMTAASIILGIAIVFFLFNSTDNEKRLNEAEASAKVTELYGGTANAAALDGNDIIVEFQTDEGRYRASVDRESGQVADVELIEKTGPLKALSEKQAEEIALEEVQGKTDEINYVKEQNEYEVKITGETEVSIVSLSAETGKISKISKEEIAQSDSNPPEAETPPEPERIITRDEAVLIAKETLQGEVQEVEFTETNDGGYYLIEIENDETDQEATVQIHAIRGDTLSVDWDD